MKNKPNSNDNNTALISVKNAAQLLGVSVRTVWRMISEGQLSPVRIRGCTRLMLSQVQALLKPI